MREHHLIFLLKERRVSAELADLIGYAAIDYATAYGRDEFLPGKDTQLAAERLADAIVDAINIIVAEALAAGERE